MAHILEYEIVGRERFTSKKGEEWVKLHLMRDEKNENRVNTVIMRAEACPYNLNDVIEVIEYAGRTEVIQ